MGFIADLRNREMLPHSQRRRIRCLNNLAGPRRVWSAHDFSMQDTQKNIKVAIENGHL